MLDKVKIVAGSVVTWLSIAAAAVGALATGLASAGWDATQFGQIVAVVVTVLGIVLGMAIAVVRQVATVPDDVKGLTTDKHQAWLSDTETAYVGALRQGTKAKWERQVYPLYDVEPSSWAGERPEAQG